MNYQRLDFLTPAICWQDVQVHLDDSLFHHHLTLILLHQSGNFIVRPRMMTEKN
jgi:hypothetical protein